MDIRELNYRLILIVLSAVLAIVIVFLVNATFGKQTFQSYSAQFNGYSPAEIIKLDSRDKMKANAALAKTGIISCKHILIQDGRIDGYTIAVANSLLGFCHLAITGGIESPIFLDCWVFLPTNPSRWQDTDYEYGKVLKDIGGNNCKPVNFG